MTTYKFGTAARAANVSAGTLRRWLDRGQIELRSTDKPAPGPGIARAFSRETIIHIAITTSLVEIGISTGRASEAAQKLFDPRKSRGFPHARDFLIGRPGGAALVLLPPDKSVDDELRNTPAAFVIDCTKITREVDARLATIEQEKQ